MNVPGDGLVLVLPVVVALPDLMHPVRYSMLVLQVRAIGRVDNTGEGVPWNVLVREHNSVGTDCKDQVRIEGLHVFPVYEDPDALFSMES